jgi:hypothetical protein|uniref:Uncharacterized protein n=1 Tax=viral metagenome TaxID=1070528 RepID=A0A6C0JQG9_9ZZZZ
MGKKCIPGVFCIENMTLFLLFLILILVIYFYYQFSKLSIKDNDSTKVIVLNPPAPVNLGTISSRLDPLNDPYLPPMKSNEIYYPRTTNDIRGAIPINVETRGLNTNYQQIGILTRSTGGDLILPLMGRRNMAGRDKWQYYTISNSGNLNTKLPISVKGKSCTNEYGCDNISNGDIVYVEGYNDSFRATVYENSTFQYLPQL